jgi:hypothetical protein
MQGWNLKWRIKRDRHPNRQCESGGWAVASPIIAPTDLGVKPLEIWPWPPPGHTSCAWRSQKHRRNSFSSLMSRSWPPLESSTRLTNGLPGLAREFIAFNTRRHCLGLLAQALGFLTQTWAKG